MNEDNREKFVASFVELESRLFGITLPASVKDLPGNAKRVPILSDGSKRATPFCIGPDTSLHLWYGQRSGLEVDRGPFTEPEAVLAAGAKKEIAYLQVFGRPLHPFHRIRRETFGCQKQSPAPHLETLAKYLRVAPYLIPRNNNRLLFPTIRHLDLNPNNIFVSDTFEITSLIDWQHCSILPLFLHCGIPASLDNFEDPVSQSLDLPQLPTQSESMDEDEQAEQYELFQKRQLHYLYIKETASKNNSHLDALTDPFSAAKRKIYEQSGDPWEGDNLTLKSGLIHLSQKWEQIIQGPDPCPISFSPEESHECLRLEAVQRDADKQMKASREMLGIGPQGWVSCEHYDRVKEATGSMKLDMMLQAESEADRVVIRDHWIYDDMDEEEYL